jgi:hypothetical protein
MWEHIGRRSIVVFPFPFMRATPLNYWVLGLFPSSRILGNRVLCQYRLYRADHA